MWFVAFCVGSILYLSDFGEIVLVVMMTFFVSVININWTLRDLNETCCSWKCTDSSAVTKMQLVLSTSCQQITLTWYLQELFVWQADNFARRRSARYHRLNQTMINWLSIWLFSPFHELCWESEVSNALFGSVASLLCLRVTRSQCCGFDCGNAAVARTEMITHVHRIPAVRMQQAWGDSRACRGIYEGGGMAPERKMGTGARLGAYLCGKNGLWFWGRPEELITLFHTRAS